MLWPVWTEASNPSRTIFLSASHCAASVQIWAFSGAIKFLRMTISPGCVLPWSATLRVSASLARRQLSEMIEIVPANKMLIGLDTGTAESCYGAAVLTRQILAEVLAEKVADGAFTRHAAEVVANRLLKDNAEEVFGSG